MRLTEAFAALEVNSSASFEEAKKSYKQLCFVWHPDRYIDNPALQQKAEAKLKQLNAAYAVVERHFAECAAAAPKPSSRKTAARAGSESRRRAYDRPARGSSTQSPGHGRQKLARPKRRSTSRETTNQPPEQPPVDGFRQRFAAFLAWMTGVFVCVSVGIMLSLEGQARSAIAGGIAGLAFIGVVAWAMMSARS